MSFYIPTIEFFDGIPEELSNVSLRRDRRSGLRSVLMTFNSLNSLERFNSFRRNFTKALRLSDVEGEMNVAPSGIKFIFGGPEGDDLKRVECKFAIEHEDQWQRFMRFMNRYAEANGMAYGEKK